MTPAGGAGYSLYLTASGHAVAGLLYGPDGALITEDQLAAAGADARSEASAAMSGRAAPDGSAHAGIEGGGPQFPPVHSSRADLFERSAAAFGFTLGDRGPPVVLFGDVLCPWSRSAVARLGREALAGRLQLRVVPVAILGAAAARRAAGIAASPDPAQAWFEDAERPAGARGAEEIAWNNALFDAWGERSVPLIVWRGPDGAVGHGVSAISPIPAPGSRERPSGRTPSGWETALSSRLQAIRAAAGRFAFHRDQHHGWRRAAAWLLACNVLTAATFAGYVSLSIRQSISPSPRRRTAGWCR